MSTPASHSAASSDPAPCAICGQRFRLRDLVEGGLVRPAIAQEIRRDHPDWNDTLRICPADLALYRSRYVHALLESEKGELSTLEREVVESLRNHQTVSAIVDDEEDAGRSLGERLSDRIAAFGGSWTFILCFLGFMTLWIVANSLVLFWRPADPYPFILLNLVLSCLAALQAPIIMMSQNRQETKDRLRARNDYQVNLKAELEIRHLHEKVDHLLSHQWERLVQIQEVQMDLLNELRRGR